MKITKQSIKDYVLFSYVVLTLLAMYSAAMFYAGTQFAHADSAPVVHQSAPSPKAAR
jgi:hypothetical protein